MVKLEQQNIVPAIYYIQEEQSETKLNFNNEKSVEEQELAEQDLKSAKALAELSRDFNYQSDEKAIKGFRRKAVQCAMESTEHSFQAINSADEKKEVISSNDSQKRQKLESTHNLSFLQREQAEAGISIISEQDAQLMTNIVNKRENDRSSYNAVRFKNQSLTDESVDKAIEIADKAYNSVKEMAEEQQGKIIKLPNGYIVRVDI